MSYEVVGFSSLDEANRYFAEHDDRSPMAMASGHVANSLVIIFDVRRLPVVKEKNPKEVPDEDRPEDDEEEEEVESPEEPPEPVARPKRVQPKHGPRLPVHGAAKHKVQAKRKR